MKPVTGVELAGRTFMTVADLIAENPKHPLLDTSFALPHEDRTQPREYSTVRDNPDMLLAEVRSKKAEVARG